MGTGHHKKGSSFAPRNEDHDADHTAVWVVSFLDLMGYRRDLEALGDRPSADEDDIHRRFANVVERHRILIEGLKMYSERLGQISSDPNQRLVSHYRQDVDIRVTGFSDSVFIESAFGHLPDSPLIALNSVIDTSIAAFFVNLRVESPLRGGLDIGYGLWSKGHLYTAATVRAVELEKCAKYPRILVGNNLIRTIESLASSGGEAGHMAQIIQDVFYEDPEDHRMGLDFMGVASQRSYARGFTADDVRKIWLFARESQGEFGARGMSKERGYYDRLVRYMEPRLQQWGISEGQ
jgi:hypothetical protein